MLTDDLIERQSQCALARGRAAGLATRITCYVVSAVFSVFFMPVLPALACLLLILAAEFLERRQGEAVLAALADKRAEGPSADLLHRFARAVLITEMTVALSIGVLWYYATPGAVAFPLGLTATALIGIAHSGSQTAPSMMLRQGLLLAVVTGMSLRDLVIGPALETSMAAFLSVVLLAGVTLRVTLLRDRAYRARLARESEHAAQQARTATQLEAKSRFIATVSHELRTSLNGVLGMAQTLLGTDLSARQRHQAQVIAESGRSLNTLLNDILDYSKLEVGKLTIEPRPENLRQSVEHIAWLHGTVASEKGLEFHVEVSPDVPSRLMLDAVRVRQCLSNLVSNAIKFTENGSIEIGVSCEACAPREGATASYLVTASVTDTGIGIPPEQGKRLFQPYTQADGTISRRFGGTGLGLSITRQLAEAMGGTVTFESIPDQGSVFRLSFMADAVLDAAGDADDAGPSLADQKVLIADDIETNRVVMRLFLKPLGVSVSEVGDGEAALAALSDTDFDAALLDINMPGIDGAEVARQVRSGELASRDMALVAISADGTTDAIDLSSGGFDGVVTKPIDPRQLQETLTAAIRTRAERAAAAPGNP